MGKCLKCGKPAEHQFRVLEVQTLHIRDLTGERRVQALGKFQNYGVCSACTQEYREKSADFRRSVLPKLAGFLAVLLFGAVMCCLFWRQDGALRLAGLAAVFCGLVGSVGVVMEFRSRWKAWKKESPEAGEKKAAWELLLTCAPRKSEDSDLTYIPVTERTLAMKNGDLMVAYDLLPQVAVKAYDLIHEDEDPQ